MEAPASSRKARRSAGRLNLPRHIINPPALARVQQSRGLARARTQDVANELSERIGYDTVKACSRSGPKGLAMRSTSETVSEHRRALMLPQELKLLPKSKAFILGAGIPPVIADKIVYYEDKAFLRRLLPAPLRKMPKGRSNALLDAEIKEPRSEVAELRAVFRSRPKRSRRRPTSHPPRRSMTMRSPIVSVANIIR